MCAQRIRSDWASAQWVVKDPSFLRADSEDSDQTGRMPRLIWDFAGRTCHSVGFVVRWLICLWRNDKKIILITHIGLSRALLLRSIHFRHACFHDGLIMLVCSFTVLKFPKDPFFAWCDTTNNSFVYINCVTQWKKRHFPATSDGRNERMRTHLIGFHFVVSFFVFSILWYCVGE